jgi:hypothetical protein
MPTVTGLDYSVDTLGDVTFWWNQEPTETASRYQLRLRRGSNTVFNRWYTAEELGCVIPGTPCVLLPGQHDLRLDAGRDYNWSIRYWNGVNGVWSPDEIVMIEHLAPHTPDRISPVSPAQGPNIEIDALRPTYSWQKMDPNATWYHLQVWRGNNRVVNEWHHGLSVCTTYDCATTPAFNHSTGNYRWRVRAWGPGGPSEWSDWEHFSISSPSVSNPMLHSPFEEMLDYNQPVFEWERLPEADRYRVVVIQRATGRIIFDRSYYAPDCDGVDCSCNGTTCWVDFESLGNVLQHNGNYRWRVRAFGPAGRSDWVRADFTIAVPPAEPATLVSPAENTILTDAVTFQWNAAENATRYRLSIFNASGTVVFNRWYSAEQAGCLTAGELCEVTIGRSAIGRGVFNWTVGSWGQGNANIGATFTTPTIQFIKL